MSGCADKGGDCENCATLAQNGLLDNQQKELCTNNGNGAQTVPVIARGTRNAILECQKQFSGRKWNCSTFLGNYPFGSFAVESESLSITLVDVSRCLLFFETVVLWDSLVA